MWLELPDGNVVKALNAIYGLKQSAMEWYRELRRTILNRNWESSKYDECLYYCRADDGQMTILTAYVDDVLITGISEEYYWVSHSCWGITRSVEVEVSDFSSRFICRGRMDFDGIWYAAWDFLEGHTRGNWRLC